MVSLKPNAFEKRDLFTPKMSSSPMHRTIACLCAVIHDERGEQLDAYSLLHWFVHVLQTLQVLDTSKSYKNLYLFLQGDSGSTRDVGSGNWLAESSDSRGRLFSEAAHTRKGKISSMFH